MADKKISALTGASTPLAGTEVLPIVQSGATVKVSVANLTVGRAVATAGGSFTDNITQSTAAKGVNFTANTPAAGMTSQLLNWYEEGTFTPTAAGSSSAGVGTYTNQTGVYTRIGRIVHVYITISWTAHTGTGNLKITGLPFSASGNQVASMFANGLTYTGTHLQPFTSGTEILLSQTSSGASDSYIPIDTSCQLFFTVAYYVA